MKHARRRGHSPSGAHPSADSGMELLGIEPLEEHARRLAALLTVKTRRFMSGGAHLKRLDAHMRVLRKVYVAVTSEARQGERPSPAAEWLLDNFPEISSAARDIRHDLPPAFYRRLPRMGADEFVGLPRVYAMALELIGRSAGRLDSQRLHRFVTAFQSITPLTMGELWAWPSVLKLALLDYLRGRADLLAINHAHRTAADRLVASLGATAARPTWPEDIHQAFVDPPPAAVPGTRARPPARCAANWMRLLAASGQTLEEAIREEGRHQASEQAFMSSLIGSLRLDLHVRLDRVLRKRQPRRTGAAPRPVGRVRADGLPEPRSLPPRRRGHGRAHRRCAVARRPESGRAGASGRRTHRPASAVRTSATT